MKFFIFCYLALLVSCSLKSNSDATAEGGGDGRHDVLEASLNPDGDSDGDFGYGAREYFHLVIYLVGVFVRRIGGQMVIYPI